MPPRPGPSVSAPSLQSARIEAPQAPDCRRSRLLLTGDAEGRRLEDAVRRRFDPQIPPKSLKKNFRPRIICIRSGLDPSYLGESFRSDLPFEGDVDVDVAFKMPGGGEREFRVVRFVVGFQQVNNSEEPVDVLFVTNLSYEQFTVEQLATLYRFRWEVERLFAIAKGVCRLDHLRSGNKDVVEAFVYASLLAVVLGLRVCSWMRGQRPRCEPSAWRVTTLVLEWLPEIARTVGRPESWLTFNALEAALWREGVNPNPGRKYTATQYTFELGWQQAGRVS